MRIHWSTVAFQQLNKCTAFIAKTNVSAAERLHIKLIESVTPLCTFPESAPIEPTLADLPEEFRSLIVVKRYKIIYTINDDIIEIHAVWDCRRNPLRLKKTIYKM